MHFVDAKLLQDGVTNPRRRTLFPNGCEQKPKTDLLRRAAKNIPSDCGELRLYVNGPARLLAIVTQICFEYGITLTLVFPEMEELEEELDQEELDVTPLRFWDCGRCGSRFPHPSRSCPHCGGLGHSLADRYVFALPKDEYLKLRKNEIENLEADDATDEGLMEPENL